MVTMVVYLKFEKVEKGKKLTHSGNHTYREPDKACCELSLEIDEEQFKQAGWELKEKRLVKVSYSQEV